MSMMEMIDTLNADRNVRVVQIEIGSNNEWNSEISIFIMDRYNNTMKSIYEIVMTIMLIIRYMIGLSNVSDSYQLWNLYYTSQDL